MSDDITVRESSVVIEDINPLDIARLIDAINTYSSQLWEIELFKLKGIPLTTVTLGCRNDSMEFDVFCASLGALIDCLDGKSIKSKIHNDDIKKKYTDLNCRIIDDEILINHLKEIFSIDNDITFFEFHPLQSIQYLNLFLRNELEDSDEIIKKLRKLRKIRNMVPIVHNVSSENVEKALDEFNIEYPIEDFEKAGKILIKEFIDFLKEFKILLNREKKRRRAES